MYYSLSGATRELAEKHAQETGADLIELHDARCTSLPTAIFRGVFRAARQKPSVLSQPLPDLSGYDTATLFAPVWASMPAPAFNNALEALARGTTVNVVLVSDSGKTGRTKVEALIAAKELKVGTYEDAKVAFHV